MSNEVKTINPKSLEVKTYGELHESFVSNNGKLTTFDKLGKKQQRNEILKLALKAKADLLDAYETINKCALQNKKMQKAIKNSDMGKKLAESRNTLLAAKKVITARRQKLETIAETAAAIGVDVIEDIDKLQLIEAGE